MALVERPREVELRTERSGRAAPVQEDYGPAPIDFRLPVPFTVAVALAFVLGAFIAYQATVYLAPTYYLSQVRVLGVKLDNPGNGIEFQSRRMQSVQEIAGSDAYLAELAARTGVDISLDELRATVDAYRPGFSGVILIEVRGQNQQDVELMGEQLMPTLNVMIDRIRDGAITVLDQNGRSPFAGSDFDYRGPLFLDPFDGRPDHGTLPPPASKNAMVGGVTGLALMIGLALLLHGRARVNSAEDLRMVFNMPLTAKLPRLGLLPTRAKDNYLKGAALAVDGSSPRGQARSIAVAGSGTPRHRANAALALAVGLASSVAEHVVVVDVDAERAPVSKRLGLASRWRKSAKPGLTDSIDLGLAPESLIVEVQRRRLPRPLRRLARQSQTRLGALGVGTGVGQAVIPNDEAVADIITRLSANSVVIVMLPRVPGPAPVNAILGRCDVSLLAVLDGWSELDPAIQAADVLNSSGPSGAGYLLLEN
jgi:capsular polysaccharide biosynthesis protein